MDELKRLIEEKKKIEAEIRRLKKIEITAGSLRFKKVTYTTGKPTEWRLYVDVFSDIQEKRHRVKSIMAFNDKSKVKKYIPELIKDLEEIQRKMEEEEDGQ